METNKKKKSSAGKQKYSAPKLKKYTFLKKEFLKYEGMATPLPY